MVESPYNQISPVHWLLMVTGDEEAQQGWSCFQASCPQCDSVLLLPVITDHPWFPQSDLTTLISCSYHTDKYFWRFLNSTRLIYFYYGWFVIINSSVLLLQHQHRRLFPVKQEAGAGEPGKKWKWGQWRDVWGRRRRRGGGRGKGGQQLTSSIILWSTIL